MRKITILIVFVMFLFLFSSCSNDKSCNKESILFEIKQGESFQTIVKNLKKQKIIKETTRFKVMAKLMLKDSKLQFGNYMIEPGENYIEIIDKFSTGKTYSIRITIPEGYTSFQIADLLSNKGICTKEEF